MTPYERYIFEINDNRSKIKGLRLLCKHKKEFLKIEERESLRADQKSFKYFCRFCGSTWYESEAV